MSIINVGGINNYNSSYNTMYKSSANKKQDVTFADVIYSIEKTVGTPKEAPRITGEQSWARAVEISPSIFGNALPHVRDAWIKAVDKTGVCPFRTPEGRPTLSVTWIEMSKMEQRLNNTQQPLGLSGNLLTVEAAGGLALSALERANNPMNLAHRSQFGLESLEREQRFLEMFLSILDR